MKVSTGHHALYSLGGGIAVVAMVVLAAGCPGSDTTATQRQQRIRTQSFTESAPVRALIAISPYVFSASRRGLERWDLESGQTLQISAEHGLPGDRVEALAYDDNRGWLWVSTDGGFTRYDVQSGTFAELPSPPMVLGLRPLGATALESAGDGGLWVGHRRGLFYVSSTGQWTDTAITEPVSSLFRSRDGWLWIGTETGLIGRQPTGDTYRYNVEQKCDLARVRFIVAAPDDKPLVVGENPDGEQRVVLIANESCASYRVGPDVRWLSASRRGDELIILTPRRLYAMRAPSGSGTRSLRRNGMRLVPVLSAGAEPAERPYLIDALDALRIPVGARIVAAAAEEVLIGTQTLGTARLLAARGGKGTEWLRGRELVRDAKVLSVACKAPKECYVGTGRSGWRYDGQGLTPVEHTESEVLAFARSAEGEVYAVVSSADERQLLVKRIDVDSSWIQVVGLAIGTPGVEPEVSFARFAPDAALWLGLRYRDDSGNLRPYGAAQVNVSLGTVRYHRTGVSRRRRRREQILPVPRDVADIAFLDNEEVWLASTKGAVQIRKQRVKVFKEGDGLKNELLRGIAVTPGGLVFAASRSGVAAFDGATWTYPQPLNEPANDIALGRDGSLWLATDQGLAVFDGARVRRIDMHRGLLENQIDELETDYLGRVWIRGSQGITVVTLQ